MSASKEDYTYIQKEIEWLETSIHCLKTEKSEIEFKIATYESVASKFKNAIKKHLDKDNINQVTDVLEKQNKLNKAID